jgi:hypothetical protein
MWLFNLATDPLAILALFLVSLLLFHALLLSNRIRSDDVNWKYVDYIWLLMSIPAIVTLTLGNSEIIRNIERAGAETTFDWVNDRLAEFLNEHYKSWCMSSITTRSAYHSTLAKIF